MILHSEIEDVPLHVQGGDDSSLFALAGKEQMLAVFAEPGKEPTEHVMNELLQAASELNPSGLRIILIVQEEELLQQETIRKVCRELMHVKCCLQPASSYASELARRLYVDPEKLPVLVLMDDMHTAVYGCSGYNVGCVALALRISKGVIKK